jgi:hypothetical protein
VDDEPGSRRGETRVRTFDALDLGAAAAFAAVLA